MENANQQISKELDLSKFPSLEMNKKQVEEHTKLVALLDKRIVLIQADWENLNDFEKNEREILLIKTGFELASYHTKKKKYERIVKDIMKTVEVIDEVHEKFDEINKKAYERAKKDKNVEEFLKQAEFDEFETNYESKITHYFALKNYFATNKISPKGKLVPSRKRK